MVANMNKDFLIVDIDSKNVTVMIATKKNGNVFAVKNELVKSYSGFYEGQILNKNELSNTVVSLLETLKVSSKKLPKDVYISVPSEFSSAKQSKVTVNFDRERIVVDDDIKYLMEKGCNFQSKGYRCINKSVIELRTNKNAGAFFDIRGMHASKIYGKISYIYAEDSYINYMIALMKRFKFKTIKFISTPWAQGMSLLDENKRTSPYIIIDIGYLSTSIMIGKAEGVLDLTTICTGSAEVVADMFEVVDLPFDTLEEFLYDMDFTMNYAEIGNAVFHGYEIDTLFMYQIVESRIKVILETLSEVIGVNIMKIPEYSPIYITGYGLAVIRGFAKIAEEHFGKKVEVVSSNMPKYKELTKVNIASMMQLINDYYTKRNTYY